MYCTYCGSRNSDDAKFCETCGKPISISQESRFGRRLPVNWVILSVGVLVVIGLITVAIIKWWTPRSAQALTISPTLSPNISLPSNTSAPATLTPPPGATQIASIDGMTMVYVPEGYFSMGSENRKSDTAPIHNVWLDAFWIDKTDVTNSMYALCVQAGNCRQPRRGDSDTRSQYYGNPQYDDFPVIRVSWNDATTYCTWAGRRLPTEAEWEKAARGTDGRIYPWGNELADATGNYNYNTGDTTGVLSYPAGASPYGALDMAGNVWNWISDWYDPSYYSYTPDRNPSGPASGTYHVIRGGSWGSSLDNIYSYYRNYNTPSFDNEYIGFRCAQDVSQ